MSCDCISKVEKIIKEKTNKSGCLDASIGVPSGVLKVNIYGMSTSRRKMVPFVRSEKSLTSFLNIALSAVRNMSMIRKKRLNRKKKRSSVWKQKNM